MILKDIMNWLSLPYMFVSISIVLFFLAIRSRKLWTGKAGLLLLLGAIVFLGFSLQDAHFRKLTSAPDNVPIIILLFAVGFFVWLALKQGHENDERLAQGKELDEVEWKEKVFVWPNLVYTELICMVIATIVLVVWSIWIPAPIEQPANPSSSPNPSKAPWYFLGLQEMLVYFDPWIAGVLLPGFIIMGLMAIPYIDKNPKGNGYYTFKERKFAITIYLFGFTIMWVLLIINGTFLRGPNWNFFGPYEDWDVHKLVPLNNVNLSEFIYVKFLGTGLPKQWIFRELFGMILVIGYFAVGHWYLAKRLLKSFHDLMGPIRFHIMAFLLLVMFATIVKMYLRWTINLKYIIAIPEIFFNI